MNNTTKIINIEKLNLDAIENLPNLILESENFFNNQIATICKEAVKNKGLKIILLAGPSAAGKTTTSSLLSLNFKLLGKRVVIISLDNFFLARAKTPKLPDGSYDFENISALNLKYLNKFVKNLLNKKRALMPIYNFKTGKPERHKEEIIVDNNTIIIFEGLHALNPNLIKQNENEFLKLYIMPNSQFESDGEVILNSESIRMLRRITRDHYSRGHSPFATIKMWNNVLDGEKLYINPYIQEANYKINSIHDYEPLLYVNYTKKLLINEKNQLPENEVEIKNIIENLIDALNHFEPIDKKLVPSNSLLWEFINTAQWNVKPIF